MPTLAERRAQLAAQGGPGNNGDFIKFKAEGETKYLRFLFDDASTIESHQKFFNEETKQWEIDQGKGPYRITFNCVEYDKGGKNPRRVRWELSEYLYNEYLSPYVEKDLPARKNVWEIKARRPGTMEVSYVAFKVEDATELTYPIPEAAPQQQAQAAPAQAPTYAQPAPQPQPQYQQPAQPQYQAPQQPVMQPAPMQSLQPTPVQPVYQGEPVVQAPVQGQPQPVKKSKYF